MKETEHAGLLLIGATVTVGAISTEPGRPERLWYRLLIRIAADAVDMSVNMILADSEATRRVKSIADILTACRPVSDRRLSRRVQSRLCGF
jgi:hypothetical protein